MTEPEPEPYDVEHAMSVRSTAAEPLRQSMEARGGRVATAAVPTMQPPSVWVVELWDEDDGWRPATMTQCLTRIEGRRHLGECRSAWPDDRFRLVRYARVTP
jgi:hypothetical protein